MVCPTITITFLGTGTSTGVPMIACNCEVCTSTDTRNNRLRSSILVESETTRIVIDTTPDFRFQMLREGIQKLDAVVFTHSHKDHIAGMDDVKCFSFFSGKPMLVYANEWTETAIRREFAYVFAKERYPGIPEVDLRPMSLEPFVIGDIPITPILVWHLKMPVYGFRIGDFTYITDANRIDPEEQEKIKGSRVMVVNALRHTEHVSHFTLQQATELVEQLQIPWVYFTHISHQLGLHAAVEDTLASHMKLAYDGLKLIIQ